MIKIVWAIFVAWFLKWFGVDYFVIQTFNELFGVALSNVGYFGLFIIIGALRWIVSSKPYDIKWSSRQNLEAKNR